MAFPGPAPPSLAGVFRANAAESNAIASHIASRYSESSEGIPMAGLLGAGLVLFLFTLVINTFAGVVGFLRSVGAPSPQTVAATSYDFKSWSDHGAQSHTMTTPSSNATVTATYRKQRGRP